MKISKIMIKDFLGVEEIQLTPGDLNVFTGPNGCGKTSILEAIEATFDSKPKRRTEVVRHGETEATLFIETDNGVSIDRKIRTDKADYLKVKSDSAAITSTESQLRSFFSGSVFRPLDFIDMKPKKQTDIILSTIEIPYSTEKFIEWFGSEDVLTGVNTEKHMLMILKDIETRHFATRQDVNRDIVTLEHQALGIEKELPDNYNGEDWENVSLQDLYAAVTEAEKINQYIVNGNTAKTNYDSKVTNIKLTIGNRVHSLDLKYKELKSDLEDIITLANNKINAAKEIVFNSNNVIETRTKELDLELKEKIRLLTEDYNDKKTFVREEVIASIDDLKDIITLQEKKISNKQVEISGLAEKREIEFNAIDESLKASLQKEKDLMGKWYEYLENNSPIDVLPLQSAATQAELMKSHLREWDRIKEIRNVKIAEKTRYSSELTNIIETARTLPSTLLKQHELPIDGIAVDENGLIRINETLLDGLSDGEKLDAALRIAHYQMGELRVLCLDRFEKLDPDMKERVIKFCEDNDIQAFITMPDRTKDDKLTYSDHI